MKIALFVNSAKTFFWHRRSLAYRLLDEGHEVVVVCSRDGETDRFSKEPFEVIFVDFSRKGTNPLQELMVPIRLFTIFKKIKPDLCHNFTIKCVIYGSVAQWFAGVDRIINSITGLGLVFVKGGLLQRLVETLYRATFLLTHSKVIFQNEDDMFLFNNSRIVEPGMSYLIPGSGVDTVLFRPVAKSNPIIKIVFASRLLRSKGVLDLLSVSIKLFENQISHILYIAGECDLMSSDSLTESDLAPFTSYEHIHFLGNVTNIHDVINQCHIACFPSLYREGVPKFLIEAASAGLALVTTDAPGCRDVVDGNGYLVEPKNDQALYDYLKNLISQPELIESMGKRSRQIAIERFSEDVILNEFIKLYQK